MSLPVPANSTHLTEASTSNRYVEAGLRGATNTQRAYAGDWARFSAWCAQHGHEPLSGSVAPLAGFLTHLADDNKSYATVQRHAAAIAKAFELAGLESPTGDKRIKVLLQGIARLKGTKQKQAPAFTLKNFKRTIASIDTGTLTGQRNRAILLLGFAGAFRRAELAALNVEDMSFDEQGLIVSLTQSKTNQTGEAEEKAVFYSADPATCPVRTLQAWLRVLGRQTGPLFVSLRKGDHLTEQRLSDQHINVITQRYFGGDFTAHSLRASFVTVAKLNGADDSEVMNQTKHRTSAMIRRYTRLDNVRQHNAGKKLGL